MDLDVESFGDLLQQAETLTAEMDSGTDLPHVERNLQQIMEAGQRLLSKSVPVSQDSTDVKASILLGSKGYELPKVSERLEGLRTATTFEPLEPVRDTDIQGFLRNERENALLAVIEQTRKNTFEEVERRHWQCMESEWEREKQKILNSLLGSGQENFDLPMDSECYLAEPTFSQGRSSLDHMEMAYARQVYVYNEQVIDGGIQPSLVDMFLETAQTMDDKNVVDLWEMVRCMVEVPMGVQYGTTTAITRKEPRFQKTLVANAKQYLEQTYKKFIITTIQDNLHQAQLGGVPGTLNLVRSFLRVRPPVYSHSSEIMPLDNQPVWALIYYCLRCGDIKAAQEVVNRARGELGDFASFFQDYASSPDNRLSAANDTKIKLQYRRVVRNSTDPYHKAVYCVVGQCDSSEDHTDLSDKTDDYLWLKLSQIQVSDGADDQDQFTLQKLQTLLYEDYGKKLLARAGSGEIFAQERGESHFNGYQQPFLYCQVLMLTGMFEAAVEFLSRVEHLRCHAVHVALVLYELRLLLLPSSHQAQLLSRDPADLQPTQRLNLPRLVTTYTRKFEATDPREALQYFFFLRNLKGSHGESLFTECVSMLVLETREFETLLGKLEPDGARKPGAIDKFHKDTQKIIERVAKDTEAKGLFEDAVKLYDLAKNHGKTLSLLNKLLSQVVSMASSPQSSRDRLKAMALGIAERYRTMSVTAENASASTFFLLLDLITFFDLCHEGNADQALQVMKQLKLLPLSVSDVEQRVNSFRNYTDEVRRCLPDILITTMNILHKKYMAIRSSGSMSPMPRSMSGDDGGREKHLKSLRNQARSLIMFAGMLPYRLPGDTNARLVQIEVLMN